MDEQPTTNVRGERSTGRILMGALLVAAGVSLLIERLGAMPTAWRLGIWPVLLMGCGLARMLQPRARGREGLFFVLVGGWWLACSTGWLSFERTWPLLVVAIGVSMMFQAATVADGEVFEPFGRRGRRRAAPWLLLAILGGAAISGGLPRRSYATASESGDGLRVYSVLGGSRNRVQPGRFTGGEVVSIMGSSTVDLHEVVLAPGQTVTIDVFTMMGGGSIRVPESWAVDLEVSPVLGGVKDQRLPRGDWPSTATPPDNPASAGQPPRLIVRGLVVMGGLVIKS